MTSVAGILEPMVAGDRTSFDEDSGELSLTFTCTWRMVASQVLPAFYNRFTVCVISCFNTSTVLPGWSLCILNR